MLVVVLEEKVPYPPPYRNKFVARKGEIRNKYKLLSTNTKGAHMRKWQY